MRLYENTTASNYETLKTLYPVWYRNVLEMDAIWKALGPQLDGMQKGLTQAVDNGFIWFADEPTITSLERFLYIPVSRAKPMIERKTLVASFSIGNGHIGAEEIKAIISIFTNGQIEVTLVGGTIDVSVTREISDRFNLADCLYILEKKVPAHLRLALRDVLLPIRLENKNRLLFPMFGAHFSFRNRGQTEPVLLNGRRALDGTWNLDQAFSGIAFQRFAFGARARFYDSENAEEILLNGERLLNGDWLLGGASRGRFYASSIVVSPMPLSNASQSHLESFGLAQNFHSECSVSHVSTQVNLRVKTPLSLSGTITMDSMYRLDGSVRLNTARRLNAKIIKEDI